MAPPKESSSLKRTRESATDGVDHKKPRRSMRISSLSQAPESTTPIINKEYLPSPLTNRDSTGTEPYKEPTTTPPDNRQSQVRQQTPTSSQLEPAALLSPQGDTQAFSQFIYPPRDFDEDEENPEEGTWGYLVPLSENLDRKLIMKRRPSCPSVTNALEINNPHKAPTVFGRRNPAEDENRYEIDKVKNGHSSGGYLLGRHPECDYVIDIPTISNRHCLLFCEHKRGDTIAILEDLSSNGTFVNEALLGRNHRRQLEDGDEITILEESRFLFKYPRSKDDGSGFRSQYRVVQQLGKGHFASVYLCVSRSTGNKFAVKKFERRSGDSQRSQTEGLQQEIGILMSVSHPNVLCLKETFDEADGVYLILELAPEGELFNWIVMRQKLSEAEARKVFIQLFQGVKYLHERNIVHRDIKPENILLADKNLSVKLADFGLSKIIGEQSFTTTLCGTPSYVAPEILVQQGQRKYTRAVDVWSLGVVLYICLCGFPPFSDELRTPEFPYNLSEQIIGGRFEYPSPYWDSVRDPALDLIDKMLTVDVNRRITVEECLAHPWTTGEAFNNPSSFGLNDSTGGLPGQMDHLHFSQRKPQRERTLLSSINDVRVVETIPGVDSRSTDPSSAPVKVYAKNPAGKKKNAVKPPPAAAKAAKEVGSKVPGRAAIVPKEPGPADNRDMAEFMGMGGKGDMQLFAEDSSSRYLSQEQP